MPHQQQQQQQADLEHTPSLQPQELFAHFLGLQQQLDAADERAAAAAREQSSRAAAAAKLRRQQQQRSASMRSMFMPVDAAAAAAAFGLQPGVAVGLQDRNDCYDSCCNSSYWQSSADMAGPSLQDWAARAEDVGLAAEVQAVWWGVGDMHEVWAVAEEGSKEAYKRYCRALWRLLEPGGCHQLRVWYEQQQFRTPVTIGAA